MAEAPGSIADLVPVPAPRTDRLLDALVRTTPGLDRLTVAEVVESGARRGLPPLWAAVRSSLLGIDDLDLLAAAASGVPVLPRIDVEGIEASVDLLNVGGLLRLPALAVDRAGRGGGVRVAVTDPASPAVAGVVRGIAGEDAVLCLAREDVLRNAIRRRRAARTLLVEEAQTGPAEPGSEVVDGESAAVVERDVDAEGPAARLVDGLIARALDEGASDVHLEPVADGLRVRFRIDGVLRTVVQLRTEHAGAGEDIRRAVLTRLKVLAGLKIDETRAAHSGRVRRRLGARVLDLRLEVIPVVVGSGSHESAVLRLLAAEGAPPDLVALGFSESSRAAFARITDRPQGLVLVVGPTGSGKSTTLFACLAEKATPDRKVLTVEDPVEHRLLAAQQVEVIAGKLSFAGALRSFMRQDPDVILVGETRDRETAQTACEAALTGHLVLTVKVQDN